MALRYEIQEIGTSLLVENWQAGLRCLSQSAGSAEYQDAHLPLPLSHLPDHFLAGIPDELKGAAAPYGELALRLLSLARQHASCAELLKLRPILLFLAALYWPQDNLPIVKHAACGQRALLHAMGLAPRRSLLRFLDRLRLNLAIEWQRDYLRLFLYEEPEAYLALRHEPRIGPVQLFLLFHAPELTGSVLIRSLPHHDDDGLWLSRLLDPLNPALALARAGRFPGSWQALRNMVELAEVSDTVLKVEQADDRAYQFQYLCERLQLDEQHPLPDSGKRLSHLQTPWLQQVVSWPELDVACARMNPRRCELWSQTMLNDILRGRQALFRLCSPRRKRVLGWVRMSLAPSAPDQPAFTSLIEVTGPKVGRVSRYWVRRLYCHLLTHPLRPGNRP
ncbi:hypothetical protein [Aeromonas salmonicida]|uniref:Uncharacterized protein n=1 Tax=Aeromonas salmonicida TaxID=645 RepID=A0AAX3VX39_AERSA|nr:hypothetical protein [Aeromonas salmonicida]WHF38172.1 hypothetical protein QLQ87_07470 [Aeromonas salmonicida]